MQVLWWGRSFFLSQERSSKVAPVCHLNVTAELQADWHTKCRKSQLMEYTQIGWEPDTPNAKHLNVTDEDRKMILPARDSLFDLWIYLCGFDRYSFRTFALHFFMSMCACVLANLFATVNARGVSDITEPQLCTQSFYISIWCRKQLSCYSNRSVSSRWLTDWDNRLPWVFGLQDCY